MSQTRILLLSLVCATAISGCVIETTVGDGTCGACAADCDGDASNGCEADLTSVDNCGACGNACAAGQICLAGGECWDPDNALIGAWTFEDGATSAVRDVSSHALDGNICSFSTDTTMCTDDGAGPIHNTGHNGRGLLFDGVDDGVIVEFSPTLQPSLISMEAWIAWNGDLDGTQQRVLEHTREESNSTASNYSMTITATGSVQVELRLRDNMENPVEMFETGVVLQTFEWTHLLVTYDGHDIIVYKNGVQVGKHGAQGTLMYPEERHSGLGIGNQTNRNRPYYGALDDVRLYNRALTAREVAARFNYTR